MKSGGFKMALWLVGLAIGGFTPAMAQQFYTPTEYGVEAGASTYFGDLNTNYGLHYIRPAGGVYIRHSFTPYIALKAMINYTQIGYDDRFSKNEYQRIRNLSFRSNIIELAVVSEFNFFKFITGNSHYRFTPFLTGGVGVFYYDPYTNYQGQRYSLRDLGTEGQNTGLYNKRKYKPVSVCFPVGAGIKYWLRPGLNFSLEVVDRLTMTDYIDDVSNTYVGIEHFASNPMHPTPAAALQDPSIEINGRKLGRAGKQRGDNSTKDQYMMINLSLSIQLRTYKCPTNRNDGWYSNF